MRALIFLLFLSSLSLAQRGPAKEEVIPDGQDDYYAEEQEEILNENDELRAENERLQGECNCDLQREDYVTQREESPVVIINELPVQGERAQQEVAPTQNGPVQQFNNNQYQNYDQFITPTPELPPPGLMPLIMPPQGQN